MKNLDKLIKLAKVYEQSKQYNLADETINKIKITLAQQTYKTNAGKAHEEAERHRGLDELVAEGQKLGMY